MGIHILNIVIIFMQALFGARGHSGRGAVEDVPCNGNLLDANEGKVELSYHMTLYPVMDRQYERKETISIK